ncbi:MAG TPA: hypothetical protein VF092_13260 [Longimicrobium sp.]
MSTTDSAADAGSRAHLGSDAFTRLVEEVDFPGFVRDLILGTFKAVVEVSVQQMHDYSRLLDQSAAGIGEFVQENLPATGRDCLARLLPPGAPKD